MLLKCVLTSILCGCVFQVTGAAKGIEVTETKKTSNEWGNYYNLPNRRRIMQHAFKTTFEQYLKDPEKETLCKRQNAKFERWYVSSQNPNHYILSYECRTKNARGYEHLKIEMDGDDFVKILDFQKALKGYGIKNAGNYEKELSEQDGRQIMKYLLPKIKAQLAAQKNRFNDKQELCPDPSDKTFVDVWTKRENGLRYYKLAISCNINNEYGYGADFKTTIEVAFDEYFNILNDGNPVFATMAAPEKNYAYIEAKEAAKQM